jgi:sec-independent protein translocase protein TatC
LALTDNTVDEEQGFLSHLIELRDRLMKMLLAVLGLFICLFPFRDNIYSWLADPLSRFLPEGTEMIAYEVASPFFIPFKLALMLSVFLAIPFLLYQIWAFVAPGLYTHEKRLVAPILGSSTILFYCGCAFAYFVVFPLVFKFFINVAPTGVQVSPDIARYLDFVITLFFAFGIAFEVPVATVLLVVTGVTTPEKLAKMRPYVFVGAFIIGMFLTPPDIISQTLLAVPMWLLFEVGVFLSKYFKVWVQEASEAREEMLEKEAEAAKAESKPTPAAKGSYRNSLTDSTDDGALDEGP